MKKINFFKLLKSTDKKKPKGKKANAILFVDYEHWYISMQKRFSIKPQIKSWRDEISEKYNIEEIIFFADFSNQGMKYEIPKIREITNLVIETQNASAYYKKDFTDFIMLDYIYQSAISKKNTDAFIIFTGDGHFSSVVKFLTNVCHKEVGIYAVRDGLSSTLKTTASWYKEIPSEEEIENKYFSMIINNLNYIYRKQCSNGRKRFYPTYLNTIDAVAEYYSQDKEKIKVSLDKMIDKNYISQKSKYVSINRRINVLYLDSEIIKEEGIEIIPEEQLLPKNKKITKQEFVSTKKYDK